MDKSRLLRVAAMPRVPKLSDMRPNAPTDTARYVWMIADYGYTYRDGTGAKAWLGWWLTPKRPVLQNLDRYYRQRIAESRKPFPLRRPVPMPADVQQLPLMGPPDLFESEGVWWSAQTLLAQLEVALVVEQYRSTHGRYPPRLDAIPRRWLPAVPKDPWDQPLCYRLADGRPVIYSRGPDGVDDKGARAASIVGLDSQTEGDLVFGRLWGDE